MKEVSHVNLEMRVKSEFCFNLW